MVGQYAALILMPGFIQVLDQDTINFPLPGYVEQMGPSALDTGTRGACNLIERISSGAVPDQRLCASSSQNSVGCVRLPNKRRLRQTPGYLAHVSMIVSDGILIKPP
ncbi:hypothetical protein CCP3SC1AL1_1420008 [Gammaproteobacteria bacterium]